MCAEHNTRSSIGNSCNSSMDTSTLLIFTIVLKLLIDMHRVLKASAQNLVYPVLDSPQPLHQRLKFLVCKLSGNPCKTPPDIIEVIMQYRRDGTHRQYNVYIKKSLQFCGEGSHDPVNPSVRSVLSFLHSLVKKGLSYSALNTSPFWNLQY